MVKIKRWDRFRRKTQQEGPIPASLLRQRTGWVAGLILFCMMMASARLGWLMIGQDEALAAAAFSQRQRTMAYDQYSRGDILDRNSRSFTGETVNCLVILPGICQDSVIAVAEALSLPAATVNARIQQLAAAEQGPILLFAGLTPHETAAVQAKVLPDVVITQLGARYRRDGLACHTIGYVQTGSKAGSWQGVSGIEYQYDEVLQDRKGDHAVLLVDAKGSIAGQGLQLVKETAPAHQNVRLTLDMDMQQLAEHALENQGYNGCAVVMEARSGDLLALASTPGFDPYHWQPVEKDAYLQKGFSLFHPASTFKLVLAAAALESGVPLPVNRQDDSGRSVFVCTGSYTMADGHTVSCAGGEAHGEVGLELAFAYSCNCYFVALGETLGSETVSAYAERFGLRELSVCGYDTPAYLGEDFLHFEHGVEAALANVCLGEDGIRVAPVQIARLLAACANGGYLPEIRLVMNTQDATGKLRYAYQNGPPEYVFSAATARKLCAMLKTAVEQGTGHGAESVLIQTAGKTGSSEDGGVWFAGLAGEGEECLIIVTYVEQGTAGGREAAAVFRQIAEGIAVLTPPRNH